MDNISELIFIWVTVIMIFVVLVCAICFVCADLKVLKEISSKKRKQYAGIIILTDKGDLGYEVRLHMDNPKVLLDKYEIFLKVEQIEEVSVDGEDTISALYSFERGTQQIEEPKNNVQYLFNKRNHIQ